jgi:uncharacterized protein YigE (DUF2233 family)
MTGGQIFMNNDNSSRRSLITLILTVVVLLIVLIGAFYFKGKFDDTNKGVTDLKATIDNIDAQIRTLHDEVSMMKDDITETYRISTEVKTLVENLKITNYEDSNEPDLPDNPEQPEEVDNIPPGNSYAKKVSHNGLSYDVFVVDTNELDLRLFWKDPNGLPYKSIENLKNSLEQSGRKLLFAINSGTYEANNTPLGLHVEDGQILSKLNTSDGNGNFFLKPNGIFFITNNNRASILNTSSYRSIDESNVDIALQSGPLLIENGNFHSLIKEDSPNKHIRSAVGYINNNTVVFAISNVAVNFYQMAEMLKFNFGCDDALLLDSVGSRMYLPELGRNTTTGELGGIIGVIK